MSEISLYRKYRPQTFADVVGQDAIVRAVEQSVKGKNISHAYLFSGGRGTGKTSIARIFAKELKVSPTDIYEIDAASNRGIDDVRELRDGVHVLPFESEYKVYIIDEVHMLTKEAFNALLKTLEEPPAHAVFILATTELEKVPETIISRCQSFVFKKPDQNTLGEVVVNIFKKEGYGIDQSSSELIALLGDGSFRDTIGVVEKVIRSLSGSSKKISRENVENITGAPKNTYIRDFITAIASKNAESGLSVLSATNKENINADLFAKLVLRTFRGAMLLKYAPAMKSDLEKELGTDDFNFIESIVTKHGDGISSKVLVHLLDAYKQISFSPMPFIPLEISMIDIAEGK